MNKEFSVNAVRLRALMKSYGKTRKDIAGLGSWAESTVDSWLAPVGIKSHKDMPNRSLELIEFKLRAGAPTSSKRSARHAAV